MATNGEFLVAAVKRAASRSRGFQSLVSAEGRESLLIPQAAQFRPRDGPGCSGRHTNVRSQPPWNSPSRAAEFYNAIVADCPACTVLGAEVLDSTDAPSYLRAMLPYMSAPPAAWGVHNYEDINHFRTTGTDPILATVPGPIWLTEAAGLVRYVDGSGRTTYPYDEQRAARATSFMFDYVEAHLDRIERLYYYVWRSGGATDTFDTGLLRADGTTRPAYDVVADRLSRLLPRAARRTPFPFQLLSRRARVGRGKVVFGPFRCVLPRQGRCVGKPGAAPGGAAPRARRTALRPARAALAPLRSAVAVRAAAALRRPHGRWKRRVRLVVRLRQPLPMSRSYPKLRYVRRR